MKTSEQLIAAKALISDPAHVYSDDEQADLIAIATSADCRNLFIDAIGRRLNVDISHAEVMAVWDEVIRMAIEEEATKHNHIEAFCLMRYQCNRCTHHEIIWNSRDGVTPFGLACPSCGEATLFHVYFGLDKYAPDHKPWKGQKVWETMTEIQATALARRNVLTREKPSTETELLIERVAEDYYRGGDQPCLRIEGYSEEFKS